MGAEIWATRIKIRIQSSRLVSLEWMPHGDNFGAAHLCAWMSRWLCVLFFRDNACTSLQFSNFGRREIWDHAARFRYLVLLCWNETQACWIYINVDRLFPFIKITYKVVKPGVKKTDERKRFTAKFQKGSYLLKCKMVFIPGCSVLWHSSLPPQTDITLGLFRSIRQELLEGRSQRKVRDLTGGLMKRLLEGFLRVEVVRGVGPKGMTPLGSQLFKITKRYTETSRLRGCRSELSFMMYPLEKCYLFVLSLCPHLIYFFNHLFGFSVSWFVTRP